MLLRLYDLDRRHGFAGEDVEAMGLGLADELPKAVHPQPEIGLAGIKIDMLDASYVYHRLIASIMAFTPDESVDTSTPLILRVMVSADPARGRLTSGVTSTKTVFDGSVGSMPGDLDFLTHDQRVLRLTPISSARFLRLIPPASYLAIAFSLIETSYVLYFSGQVFSMPEW